MASVLEPASAPDRTPFVELGELMSRKPGSINPAKHKDQTFELYSIPAYEAREPEVQPGAAIGSSKQLVQPNDVLVSKIVPHIRRAWVVGPKGSHEQIASGEWIPFRSDRVEPNYLRHLLISDWFHPRFMQTVSGVGGSLLRARPAEVAKIKVPLPPLPEQRRIAAILDKVDALRLKRREAIAKLDQLLQSVFLEMFGDPVANPQSWPLAPLESFVTLGPSNGISKTKNFLGRGTALIDNKAVYRGRYVDFSDHRLIDVSESERRRFRIGHHDLLFNRVSVKPEGVGVVALAVNPPPGSVFESNLMRVRLSREIDPIYALFALRSESMRARVRQNANISNQASINQAVLRKLMIAIPPKEKQKEFSLFVRRAEHLAKKNQAAFDCVDGLMCSLQQRAFNGQL